MIATPYQKSLGAMLSASGLLGSRVNFLLPLLCSPLLAACGGGGGGGGDDFVGAARVSLSVSPSTIDIADRARVIIDVRDVNESGIALKVRFPKELSYVPSSSKLIRQGDESDLSPDVLASDDNYDYVVYYLSENRFGSENEGAVELLVVGDEEIRDGMVEIDADVDDPLKDNATEFDVNNPAFEQEDAGSLSVRDD